VSGSSSRAGLALRSLLRPLLRDREADLEKINAMISLCYFDITKFGMEARATKRGLNLMCSWRQRPTTRKHLKGEATGGGIRFLARKNKIIIKASYIWEKAWTTRKIN